MPKPAKDPAETDLRRAEKREGEIRIRFAAVGGLSGSIMQAITRFFSRYAESPRPDLFLQVLDHVKRLQLMALPEHRHGLGGSIAAIVSLHPEHQDAWRAAHRIVIESAERLSPPILDEEVSRPGQADYLWMLWVVTRDRAALQRIVRLAHRHDTVGEAALGLLTAHATMPEVQDVLLQTLQSRQAQVIPHFAQAPAMGDVPIADIRSLRDAIVAYVPNLAKVVLVGWLVTLPKPPEPKAKRKARGRGKNPPPPPIKDPIADGGFLVITIDGKIPIGCPPSWKGKPVLVRKAKPAEMKAHRAMHDAAEEP